MTPRATRVVIDDVGLQLADATGAPAKPTVRLAWADVTRATAYKRDLFSVDLVCLLFESADGRWIEVDEELAGWHELLETLPRALPGALDADRLLRAVVQPPFATNETLVYARGAPPAA